MIGKVCEESHEGFCKPIYSAFLIFPGDAELLVDGVLCLNSDDDISNYMLRMLR